MKILQINVVYKKGSTGKIVDDLHTSLIEDGHQSYVYYGRGKRSSEKNVVKIAPEIIMKLQSLRSRITGYAYSGCFFSTRKLIRMILECQPDVVHLQCMNGFFVNIYKLLDFLKRQNIPTTLTLHAEFMYTAGCGHAFDCEKWKTGCFNCPQLNQGRPKSWFFDRSAQDWKMMKDAFENFNNLMICPVSGWLENRAKQSPFLKDKLFQVVENGLDSTLFHYYSNNELRKKLSLKKDVKVILHVTPDFNSPIKGGQYVIELANRVKNQKNLVIVIVGLKNTLALPENCIAIEHTNDQKELAKYY
ncbi:MAG: glycosyltransferase, partial [Eubacterium sp.]